MGAAQPTGPQAAPSGQQGTASSPDKGTPRSSCRTVPGRAQPCAGKKLPAWRGSGRTQATPMEDPSGRQRQEPQARHGGLSGLPPARILPSSSGSRITAHCRSRGSWTLIGPGSPTASRRRCSPGKERWALHSRRWPTTPIGYGQAREFLLLRYGMLPEGRGVEAFGSTLADYIFTEISVRASTCGEDAHYKAIDNGLWYLLGQFAEPPQAPTPTHASPQAPDKGETRRATSTKLSSGSIGSRARPRHSFTFSSPSWISTRSSNYAQWSAPERRSSTGFLRGSHALRCSRFALFRAGRSYGYANGRPSLAAGAVAEPREQWLPAPRVVLWIPEWQERTTQGSCPRGTRGPRLRPKPHHRPAQTPGMPSTQEGHHQAPTTAVAVRAQGAPPQGGPRRSPHRGPELTREREEPLPRDGAGPRRTHAPPISAGSTSSATSKGRASPSRPQTSTLSSSGSLHTATRNSTAIARSPDGPKGMRSRRPSESCGQRECPRAGTAVGRCGRARELPLIFPRPAYPGLFPQAPWRPCRIEGCGSHGKCLAGGIGTGPGPPWAVDGHPPRPCQCGPLPHLFPVPSAPASGAQACARPEGGCSLDFCRLTGRIACLRRYGFGRRLRARARGAHAGDDSCFAAPPHSPSWWYRP